jgi:hypothetical protein
VNYTKKSNEFLVERKEKLIRTIKDYEKMIETVRSQVYCLYMQYRVNKMKDEIQTIDTELASRSF